MKEVQWYTKCNGWVSKNYQLRIEVVAIKRVLDVGTCECPGEHLIYRKEVGIFK